MHPVFLEDLVDASWGIMAVAAGANGGTSDADAVSIDDGFLSRDADEDQDGARA